jgi:hypothetical protein
VGLAIDPRTRSRNVPISQPERKGEKMKHLMMLNLNCTPLNLDKSGIGITIDAKIAANIAITPNNWLGYSH